MHEPSIAAGSRGTGSTDRVVQTTRTSARVGEVTRAAARFTDDCKCGGDGRPCTDPGGTTSMMDRFNALGGRSSPARGSEERETARRSSSTPSSSPSSSSASCSPSRGRGLDAAPSQAAIATVTTALGLRSVRRRSLTSRSFRRIRRRLRPHFIQMKTLTHTRFSRVGSDSGQTFVEFAIVLPILVLLSSGSRSSGSPSTTTSRSPTRRASARVRPRSSGPAGACACRNDRNPEHGLGEAVERRSRAASPAPPARTSATRSRSRSSIPYRIGLPGFSASGDLTANATERME